MYIDPQVGLGIAPNAQGIAPLSRIAPNSQGIALSILGIALNAWRIAPKARRRVLTPRVKP